MGLLVTESAQDGDGKTNGLQSRLSSDKRLKPGAEFGFDWLIVSQIDRIGRDVQGYLAHKKLLPPMTLQQAYAYM